MAEQNAEIRRLLITVLKSKHPLRSLGVLAVASILFFGVSYLMTRYDQTPLSPTNPALTPEVKGAATDPAIAKQSVNGMVSRVIDGDTIEVVVDGQSATVRLIGFDTPESVDPRKPVQCFSHEATEHMKELALNKTVQLEPDTASDNTDKYHRLLRYVYREDGSLVNESMIRDGYAREYTYDIAYDKQRVFKQAETEAKTNDRGLWSPQTCNGTT